MFKYYLFSLFFPLRITVPHKIGLFIFFQNLLLAFWFSCFSITMYFNYHLWFSSLQYWTSTVTIFFFKFLYLKKILNTRNWLHYYCLFKMIFLFLCNFISQPSLFLNFLFLLSLIANCFFFLDKDLLWRYTKLWQSSACYYRLEHRGRPLKQASLIQICFTVFELQQQGTLNLFFQFFLRL